MSAESNEVSEAGCAGTAAVAADGVYFGPINYLDRTGIKDLPRARAYFESADYQALVGQLEQSLAKVGL